MRISKVSKEVVEQLGVNTQVNLLTLLLAVTLQSKVTNREGLRVKAELAFEIMDLRGQAAMTDVELAIALMLVGKCAHAIAGAPELEQHEYSVIAAHVAASAGATVMVTPEHEKRGLSKAQFVQWAANAFASASGSLADVGGRLRALALDAQSAEAAGALHALGAPVKPSGKTAALSMRIDDVIENVRSDDQWVEKILPSLPVEWQEYLFSDEVVDRAMAEFDALDADGNGVLSPDELAPVVANFSRSQPWEISAAQCRKFAGVFDADGNGTIERIEFFRFMQFVIVMTYVQQAEAEGAAQAEADAAELSRVEAMIAMVRDDNAWVEQALPQLPAAWQEYLVSDAFVDKAMAEFDALDADGNGVLSPDELAPVVVSMSQSEPWAITYEHCLRFASVFDADGNGTIERVEFLRFMQFLVVMQEMQAQEAAAGAGGGGGGGGESARLRVDDVIELVRRDSEWVEQVLPSLPAEWQDYLFSDELVDYAMEHYDALDVDASGALTPDELVPVIVSMSEAKPWDIDEEQCRRFVAIFDKDRSGQIERVEFFRLMQFIVVMSFVSAQDDEPPAGAAADDAEVLRIDEVIENVRDDAAWADKILPTLPDEWREYLMSDEFVESSMEKFDALDVDHNGHLSPDELAPVVAELSQGQPWDVDAAHCHKFAEIFDKDGNGKIDRVEFFRFVQFLVVMSTVGAQGAQGGAADDAAARADDELDAAAALADAAEQDKAIEGILKTLEKGKGALFEVMSLLPPALCEHLDSPEFQLSCYEQFDGLDEDQSGSLTVDELYPVIANLAGAREWAVTDAQCARFAKMFDEDGNGSISKSEFVGFMQFAFAVLHCEQQRKVEEAEREEEREIAEGDKAIESLLAKLEKGKGALFEVMSQLPSELCEHLDSPEFQLTCYEQFDGLDADQSGSLTVDELYPVIASLAGTREWIVTDAQCARFAKMFDEDGNGDISKTEFVGFMQFTLAMLHCNQALAEAPAPAS